MNFSSLIKFAGILVVVAAIFGCARTIEQRSDMMVQRFTWELNLNKEQQDAVKLIKAEFFQKLRAQKEARLQLKDELIALVKSDAVDPVKLGELRKKVNDLNQELMDFVASKFIDFQKTLTPVQKEKAAKWIEKTAARMQRLL